MTDGKHTYILIIGVRIYGQKSDRVVYRGGSMYEIANYIDAVFDHDEAVIRKILGLAAAAPEREVESETDNT